MSKSFGALTNVKKESLKIARSELLVAQDAVNDALEVGLLAVCLRNAREQLAHFLEDRVNFLEGELDEEIADKELDSFEEWLKSPHQGRTMIVSANTMTIYESTFFEANFIIPQAEHEFLPVWRPRLPRVVEQLNKHPLMRELPKVELIFENPDKFEFEIRFVIADA